MRHNSPICAGFLFCVLAPIIARGDLSAGTLEPGSASAEQQAAIAAHFRQRPALDMNPVLYGLGFLKPDWWKIAKRDEPDRVLKHEFAMAGIYTQFPSNIEWNTMIDQDRETMWNVNRFNYLLVLQEADEQGRDAKYARKGVELMLDWAAKCPVAKADEQWAAWRPLEIGLRLSMWTRFLDYAARKDIVSPAELCALLESLREQCDRLASVTRPGRGNHGFMENMGLGMAALVFPELKGAEHWRAICWRDFESDVRTQVYPDGSHEEMSPIYEFTVLYSVARVAYLAQQRNAELPPIVLERLRAMNRYLTFIRKPDNTLPAFNDGDRYDLSLLFEAIARWQQQRDVLWVLTVGKEGEKPENADFFAPYSGLVIFRTDFGPQAQSLLMDAGPFGTGHQHYDALQVEYSAFGQDFLVEPGRYTYRSDDPIRQWLVGTHAHCTITVDGGQQRMQSIRESWRTTQPIDAHIKSNEIFAYARALYRYGYDVPGAENIVHRRSIFFVPGRYVVIYDLVQGQGEHRVHLHWSFPPLDVLAIDDHSVLASGPAANLLLRTVGPSGIKTSIVTGQRSPAVGWFSEVYDVVHPAPHVSMTTRVDLPARFATLLVPYKGQQDSMPAAQIAIDTSRDEQVRVTLGTTTEILNPAGVSTAPE